MRRNAALRYPVARSRRVGICAAALALMGAGSVAAWSIEVPGAPLGQLIALPITALAGACFALLYWWRTESGYLCFDGLVWRWEREFEHPVDEERGQQPGLQLTVVLDWQSFVLISCVGHGQPRWLWLEDARDPAHWHALRCQLHAGSGRPARPEAVGKALDAQGRARTQPGDPA